MAKLTYNIPRDYTVIDLETTGTSPYKNGIIGLFRGNGGCFSSAIPVFMLIKWPLIFGWEV